MREWIHFLAVNFFWTFERYQERIMREGRGRGKEREAPTHLMKNSKLTHAARVTKNSKRMRLRPACVIANADVGTLARDREDGAGEAYCSRSLDRLRDEVVENSSTSNRNVRASRRRSDSKKITSSSR